MLGCTQIKSLVQFSSFQFNSFGRIPFNAMHIEFNIMKKKQNEFGTFAKLCMHVECNWFQVTGGNYWFELLSLHKFASY